MSDRCRLLLVDCLACAVYQTAHEKARPQGNDETYGRATTTFIHSETVQPPYCFQFVPTGYNH
jgi:hypothetical protein